MPKPVAYLLAAVLAVVLADFAPTVINGLLLLVLAGVILKNSDKWTPWLQGAGK